MRSAACSGVPTVDELANLKAKLKAREGKPGFKQNVEHLKARIAELEAARG
jgi:hypothetical protein